MGKLIIFDFDGVLREASYLHVYNAYIALIKYLGKDPNQFFTDMESFRVWYNVDWHKNEEKILGHAYTPDKSMNHIFHANYDANAKLFPWVSEALEVLSKKYQLAIFSSSTRTSVKASLGELSRYFSWITGAEEVNKLKPDPEGVFLTLKETGTDVGDALIIGDMNVDFLAGKKAGIKVGLVKWGLGEWEELSMLGADILFEDPKELMEL
ncbi:MAG: HAD-IA family hydrolase [Candidatus Parcubacteria bacterium]|nr:HAD-IA family hydrolase [Candidatus Parcubacteria bacterium]